MELTAGQIVASAAGGILLKEAITYFWKKFIRVADGNYVTEKTCRNCKADQEHAREQADKETAQELRSFKKEMREEMGMFRGILLVMAIGKPVSEEDLQKLVKRS